MTKKLTISVPDEVAERLSQEENVSSFVSGLVRGRMGSEEIQRWFRERGTPLSEEGMRRAGEQLDQLRAGITPELRAQAEELAAALRANRRAGRHGAPGTAPA